MIVLRRVINLDLFPREKNVLFWAEMFYGNVSK